MQRAAFAAATPRPRGVHVVPSILPHLVCVQAWASDGRCLCTSFLHPDVTNQATLNAYLAWLHEVDPWPRQTGTDGGPTTYTGPQLHP